MSSGQPGASRLWKQLLLVLFLLISPGLIAILFPSPHRVGTEQANQIGVQLLSRPPVDQQVVLVHNIKPGKEGIWLYRRGGKLPAAEESLVEAIFVGDIFLGRGVQANDRVFLNTARELTAADLAIGNLEGVITSHSAAQASNSLRLAQTDIHSQNIHSEGYQLIMPAGAIAALQSAGFDVLGLANNHALDHGAPGLARTLLRLETAGIKAVGAGLTASAARQPVILTIRDVRIAFLAASAISAPGIDNFSGSFQVAGWDEQALLQSIRSARRQADAVVVLMHWGTEYQAFAGLRQEQAAQAMIEAGADLVVGHHPHTIQQTRVFERNNQPNLTEAGLVAFSLGNFVFDQFDERTQEGLALRVFLDQHGLRAVQALPLKTGSQPRWINEEDAQVLERALPPTQPRAFRCDEIDCWQQQPVEWSLIPKPPAFFLVDLTGDGTPERALLAGGRVFVYDLASGQLSWESPPDWQVLDLAAGDPNTDGRQELMLAMRKKDKTGSIRSHPFIIGYRSGIYRQIWGGSAVADPILELDVSDIDQDGDQELIIIEERPSGQPALTVWDWNGWGFSLAWRSQEGWFRDLSVAESPSGAVILVGESW